MSPELYDVMTDDQKLAALQKIQGLRQAKAAALAAARAKTDAENRKADDAITAAIAALQA